MKHVCNGAMLKCTTGTMPCSLSVTSNPIVKSDGQLVATMADCAPFVNIKPFGQCMAQMTPSGPLPCNLALVGPWVGTHATFLVNGNPALLSTSKLTCAMGSISITMPAQMTMARGGGVPGASIGSMDIPPVDINLPEEEEAEEEEQEQEENQENSSAEGGEASSQSEASNDTSSEPAEQAQSSEEEQEEEVVEKRIEIELKYPDGTIPEGVGYKILDESDGELAAGTLDDSGYALVEGLSTDKVKVVFTEDKRAEPLIEKEPNPNYSPKHYGFTTDVMKNGYSSLPADFNSYTAQDQSMIMNALSYSTPSTTSVPIDRVAQSMMVVPEEQDDEGFIDWIFEALKGDFAEDRNGWQIFVDAAISMIPVIDQVCDARDIIANTLLLTDEDQRNDTGAWIGIVFCGIGLAPTAGSAAKGALKIVFKYADEAADVVFPYIRKYLKMDPAKYLKEIDWAYLAKEVPRVLDDLILRIKKFLNSYLVPDRFRRAADKLRKALTELSGELADGIKKALDELNKMVDNLLGYTDEVPVLAGGYPLTETTKVTEEIGNKVKKYEIDAKKVGSSSKKTYSKKMSGTIERTKDGKKVIENKVIPKGYKSSDELIAKVKANPKLAEEMGYSSPEALEETLGNLNKYLNTNPMNKKKIINSKYAGGTLEKEISMIDSNGKSIIKKYSVEFDELGFPKFENTDAYIKGADIDLTKEISVEKLSTMNGKDHMKKASELLQKKIDSGEIDLKQLLKDQGVSGTDIEGVLENIKAGKSSLNDIVTWHHHQETGKLILVRSNVHSAFKHTGGNQLWGSGVH